MNKVPMTVGGEVFDFWVCEEGDFEAPARIAAPEEVQAVTDETDQ